jgi:hypothetical protein
MSLVVKRKRFELPPEGLHRSIVASVEEVRHDDYGEQVRFRFELAELKQEDGHPMAVFRSCSFNLSPTSTLTKVVEGILGRALTTEQAEQGYDLETLVGRQVDIVVKHKRSAGGNTYAVPETIIHRDEANVEGLPF